MELPNPPNLTSPASLPREQAYFAKFGRPARFFVLGILLPIIALGFELANQFSEMMYFDPVPTYFHILLIAFVALANTQMYLALKRQALARPHLLAHCNAFAMGIAVFYCLAYLPVLPISVLLILWFGFGLLPLAPFFALISVWQVRKAFRQALALEQRESLPSVWKGVVAAFLCIFALELPAAITSIGMQLADSSKLVSQQMGLRILRAVGDQDLMLARCYPNTTSGMNLTRVLIESSNYLHHDAARTIFFRVTGKSFNEFPVPLMKQSRREAMRFRFSNDEDLGGETVGQRNQNVSLTSSRIDGSLDPQAANGYLEWTMVFTNRSSSQQEGRTEIMLPPGAVVSRLTLWVNGEEREAAFAGRGAVRAAYQAVVRKQQDPVLVTSSGKDRVLVQFFPIPPNGGEMKIRIGMTTPMQILELNRVLMQLPAFNERNFDIAPEFKHSVWLEAKTPLWSLSKNAVYQIQRPDDKTFTLRGEILDQEMGQVSSSVSALRDPARNQSWSTQPKHVGSDNLIVQEIKHQPYAKPKRVVFVIDGSASMEAVREQISNVLASMPSQIELGLVIAHDNPQTYLGKQSIAATRAAQHVRKFDFVGGQDNLPALIQAWDWASAMPYSVLVWVHGAQPATLSPAEPLLQRLERQQKASATLRFFDLQVHPGRNVILEKVASKFEDSLAVHSVPRLASVEDSLHYLLRQWRTGEKRIEVHRRNVPQQGLAKAEMSQTSDHLARLWAHQEVTNLLSADKADAQALALAQRYQLVTAVSGAVVLETQAQYDAAGLSPVAQGSVPTIPEPETWLLLGLVLLVLAGAVWQRRKGLKFAQSAMRGVP